VQTSSTFYNIRKCLSCPTFKAMTLRVAYIFLVLAVRGHADFVVEPASGSAVTSTDEGMELLQMRGAEAKSLSIDEGDTDQELVDMLEQKALETSDWGWAKKAKAALAKLFGINKKKQEKAEQDLAAAEAAKKESARLAAEKKAQKAEAQAVAAAKKAEAALKKQKEAEAAAEAHRLAAEAKAEAEAIKLAEHMKKAQQEADLKKAQDEAAKLAAEKLREACPTGYSVVAGRIPNGMKQWNGVALVYAGVQAGLADCAAKCKARSGCTGFEYKGAVPGWSTGKGGGAQCGIQYHAGPLSTVPGPTSTSGMAWNVCVDDKGSGNGPFVLGDYNGDASSCPAGTAFVTGEADCQAAAQHFGLPARGKKMQAHQQKYLPPGCVIGGHTKLDQLWFNKFKNNVVYQTHSMYAPICKKA